MLKVTPETAFTFTKFTVSLVLSWPPSKNASKREIIIYHIKWWISWINSILLVIPLFYAAHSDRKDILSLTKSLCLAVSCSQTTIKMLICMLMRNRMQFVLDELERYVRDSAPQERELFLYHIKQCGIIHVCYISFGLLATAGVICGPLILPQSLPTDAKYPFSVEKHPVLEMIYVQQSIAGLQVASISAIDCQVAMMLWCIIVRLKYLRVQMKNINNLQEFPIYVQKHQYILRLSKEVIHISRYISLTTVIMTTLSIILGGVHIVGNEPMVVKGQFTIVVVEFCGLLYISAWPAEILIRSTENIGSAIYESDWEKINDIKKSIMVMQRSKYPVVIKVSGIFPPLSLTYYATFLSRAFSFFTTIRIVLSKMELTDSELKLN